jgi:hypothetical protein
MMPQPRVCDTARMSSPTEDSAPATRDVRALLRTRTRALRAEGLDVEALRLEVPAGQPDVLRVRARLR